MRLRIPAGFVTCALLVGAMAPLGAQSQSLAELARKEEERRKAAAAAKDSSTPKPKVYTNADVGNVPAPLAPAAVPAGDAAAKGAEGKPADAAAPATAEGGAKPAAAADAAPAKDQAYWSGKAKELRTQIDRDRTYVDALQTRVNSLTTDFVNTDDPARRATIDADRKRSLEEIARLQKSIADQQKNLAAFEEDARRAGVPPGWLR